LWHYKTVSRGVYVYIDTLMKTHVYTNTCAVHVSLYALVSAWHITFDRCIVEN